MPALTCNAVAFACPPPAYLVAILLGHVHDTSEHVASLATEPRVAWHVGGCCWKMNEKQDKMDMPALTCNAVAFTSPPPAYVVAILLGHVHGTSAHVIWCANEPRTSWHVGGCCWKMNETD